ncbi:MAG: hypothetical protein CMJ81_00830 [Planctomycetaceae bacterium]|nr:hypothetical protein [Planctomycetaceae bacterium]
MRPGKLLMLDLTMTDLDSWEPGFLTAGGAALLGLVATTCLLRNRKYFAGTTLWASWCWTLVAVACVAGVEVFAGMANWNDNQAELQSLRFLAGLSTCCPGVAILGAKRPQHRVWQFAVISLWTVVALPVAESWFLGPGGPVHTQGFRAWFLCLIVFVCSANFLPTRFGWWACGGACSQLLLLAGHIPLLPDSLGTAGTLSGMALAVGMLVLVASGIPARSSTKLPAERMWIDFRDAFGVLWALRIAERVNEMAQRSNGGLHLEWRGIRRLSEDRAGVEIDSADLLALDKNLRSLLRRFVSRDWLDRRKPNEAE